MNPAPEDCPNASAEEPLEKDTLSWLDMFTPGRLAGLIALFLFALYPGVILGTHSFFFRDFGLFTYPVAITPTKVSGRAGAAVESAEQLRRAVSGPMEHIGLLSAITHLHDVSVAVVVELFLPRPSGARGSGHVLAGLSLDSKPAGGEHRRVGLRAERTHAQQPDVDQQSRRVKLAAAGHAVGRTGLADGEGAAW